MDVLEGIFEQRLLTLSEVFVYKVPPLRSASGHRAEEWGLEKPLFTGCLKVFQADTKLRIVIYQYRDPTCRSTADDNVITFAECPVELKPKEQINNNVDSVIDSSRYYVLKIKDPKSNRSTLIGIGFRERDYAFDFKSVLNDYIRYIDRMDQAAHAGQQSTFSSSSSSSSTIEVEEGLEDLDVSTTAVGSSSSSSSSAGPVRDYSIKAGEKIKIPTKALVHKPTSSNSTAGKVSSGSVGVFRLPPPTTTTSNSIAAAATSATNHISTEATSAASVAISAMPEQESIAGESDDWGDFETA